MSKKVDLSWEVAYDRGVFLDPAWEKPFMCFIISGRVLVLTLTVITSLTLVTLVGAQESGGGVEQKEVQSLIEAVEEVVESGLASTERPFEWESAYLRTEKENPSDTGTTYVIFTVVIDPMTITTPVMAMYLHVRERSETPAQSTATAPQEPEEGQEVESDTFDDWYMVELDQSEQVAHRVSRAFSVPGGDYDVYVAIKEATRSDLDVPQIDSPAIILKEEVTVPDLWDAGLTTSSIILADQVETLPSQPSAEEQRANPYTLGTTRIVPASDSIFALDEDLSLVFLVYNAVVSEDSKPDVTIEYSFHQITANGEEYFNKTPPQNFNPETLPPSFVLEEGHPLVAGQAIPVSFFPAGDYRLEIKVTDNAGETSLTRDVPFTVSGS